jgi:putative sigma-54 modulation protein
MNLQLTGHHIDITPALRAYVEGKLERLTRHFDHVIDASVVLTVEGLQQICECTLHLRGKDLFAEAREPDMYASIDVLVDKLDRQIVKHKEKVTDHRPEAPGERSAAVASATPVPPARS